MYVFLHQQYTPKVSKPLTIGSKNVAFLIDPIHKYTEFQSNDAGDEWLLTFFKGSPFPKSIAVRFSPADDCSHKCLARAAWFDNRNGKVPNSQFQDIASQFARGSDALDVGTAIVLTENRSLLTDRSTCLYFSFDKSQFERIVVCLALAAAYTLVVRECLQAMTTHIKDQQHDAVLALYDSMLKFNAADYFALPVLLDRHELMAAWDLIYQHFRLKSLHDELTDQLTRVAALLRSDAERVQRSTEALQQAHERRRDGIITGVGLVIAFVSLLQLLQLVELKPNDFSEAKKNWLGGDKPTAAPKDGVK
jgi:hypothetical protein